MHNPNSNSTLHHSLGFLSGRLGIRDDVTLSVYEDFMWLVTIFLMYTQSPTFTLPLLLGTPLHPTQGFSLCVGSIPVLNFINTLKGTALSRSPVSGLTLGSYG